MGSFVLAAGVRLHYVSRGSGPPVVFLHSGGGLLLDFVPNLFDLAAHDFQVLAFDRAGLGYSERPPGTLSLGIQARLLHDALLALNVQRPVLVGHSYGGALALNYTLAFPADVSGIVLLAAPAFAEGLGSQNIGPEAYIPGIPVLGDLIMQTLIIPVGPIMAKSVIERAFSPDAPSSAPPGFRESFTALLFRPGHFKANAEEVGGIRTDLAKMQSRYQEISTPTVIVTGDSDRIVNPDLHARPLHRLVPQSKLVVLPGTGHMIPQTRPKAVMEAIHVAMEGRRVKARPQKEER